MEIIVIVEKFDLCFNNVILCMHSVELEFIIGLIRGIIMQGFYISNLLAFMILYFLCLSILVQESNPMHFVIFKRPIIFVSI